MKQREYVFGELNRSTFDERSSVDQPASETGNLDRRQLQGEDPQRAPDQQAPQHGATAVAPCAVEPTVARRQGQEIQHSF